jgi:hypothetical protein
VFQEKLQRKSEQILGSIFFFFFENRAVCEVMWKHTGAGQATGDNMARAHCMLDN